MIQRLNTPYAGPAGRSIAALVGLLLVFGGAPGLRAGADPDSAQTRVWPLDLPEHYLTSNFMEYRPGRYHAGLDFKTRSLPGFVVRAVEDGYIERIRATPGAYGRAIYLRGDSGRTFVYAHLGRFNDVLRRRLQAVRTRTGRYRARLEFQPGEIPVTAADVLGLSGQSGTLGPHLHFEVRDAGQRPMDPQSEGFAVPDHIAPVIHHVRAVPAQATATAGGMSLAVLCPCAERDTLPALAIEGPVAFAARITEQSDRMGHVLEPAKIEVRLDGAVVYSTRNERFAFDEVGQQRLEWLEIPAHDGRARIRERWLHRRPENHLPGRSGGLWYLGAEGEGLAAGRHELSVTATDRAGNRDRVIVPLIVGAATPGEGWEEAPALACLSDATGMNTNCLTPFFQVKSEGGQAASVRTFSAQFDDPVLAPVQVLWDWLPQDAGQRTAAAQQGLLGSGPCLRITAADWPLDGKLAFAWPDSAPVPDAADSALGVYSWDGQEWDWEGSPLRPGPANLQLGIARRRAHTLLADFRPPRLPEASIDTISFSRGPVSPDPAVTLPRWEIRPLAVVDDGSGIQSSSIQLDLGGRRLIPEPDLVRDRILIQLPDSCRAGSTYELVLTVADRAGNRVQASWAASCRVDSDGGAR